MHKFSVFYIFNTRHLSFTKSHFIKYSLFWIAANFFVQATLAQNNPTVSKKNNVLEISNSLVKAKFTQQGNKINQEYYAKNQGEWTLVAASFHSPEKFPADAPQLFNSTLDPAHRFLANDVVQYISVFNKEKDKVSMKLSGMSNHTLVTQYISLQKEQSYFHIEVEAALEGQPPKLDYLLSVFTFNFDKAPTFVHTPALKFDNEDSKQNRFKILPAKDQIIGDRAFHSPAVILQENNLFTALVPDLDAINKYAVISPDARRTIDIGRNKFSVPIVDSKYTMPTGLDLNVKSGLTPKPVFSFGIMDNIIAHHLHYQRKNDTSMIRTLTNGKIRYAFDLFIGADNKDYNGYQTIVAYQWEKYGHPVFMNETHLTMPFEEYFRIVDSVTFHPSKYPDIDIPLKGYDDYGSWLQFDMNGVPVGGYRSAINWWNDVMHNSEFWNNARDASGFWFWGKQMNRPDLIDKAHRIINFCLQAPRNEQGLFATLYNANDKTWGLQWSDPPNGKNKFFLRQSDSYSIPAMSKTAAHLLDYFFNCEDDIRIVNYLKPYADWLLTVINERGAVPSYVTKEMQQSPILLYSAQPAASMWFFASMYLATKNDKYKTGAEKIAAYLEKEILPEAKWTDLEQYFSDGFKPLEFERDILQNQICRGNLSIIWASEGFARLYEATNNKQYLKDGEKAIDYLSFFQCSWHPHFIYTAFPFGGFTADNADNATFLDARQAETVKPYIWYGKLLGRQDLLERGVAAAKASAVLMNLPQHKANDIYSYTNIYPYGFGPENIDHEAHPQSAMRTSPSWGEGSGVFTGLAEAYRALNGGYIDFAKNIKAGVNGIVIENAKVKSDTIYLTMRNSLSGIKMPWQSVFELELNITGLSLTHYIVYINGKGGRLIKREDLNHIPVKVFPNGTVTLN